DRVTDRRVGPIGRGETAADLALDGLRGGQAVGSQEAMDAGDEGDRRRLGDRQAIEFVAGQPFDPVEEAVERLGRGNRRAAPSGWCRLSSARQAISIVSKEASRGTSRRA